jgi:hypothetical protein
VGIFLEGAMGIGFGAIASLKAAVEQQFTGTQFQDVFQKIVAALEVIDQDSFSPDTKMARPKKKVGKKAKRTAPSAPPRRRRSRPK